MAQLIIECLCEELPYGMIEPALQALNKGCRELLRNRDRGVAHVQHPTSAHGGHR